MENAYKTIVVDRLKYLFLLIIAVLLEDQQF